MYITGSITDANPGPALYALMAPALTTAGFTLVDTVTISTRTHKVWKSAAANNTQGLDWYLDIGYTTTGAGTIALIPFEYFDPATDLGYRGPYSAGSSVIDAATYSRFGATGSALETNWLGAQTAGLQTAISTTAFGYWISATTDRVILMCSTAADKVMYAGFYSPDPLYSAKAGAGLYPLIVAQIGQTTVSLTRLAPFTAFYSGGDWSTAVKMSPVLANTFFPQLPSEQTTGYPHTCAPIQLGGAGSSFHGGRWGWFRDVYGLASSTVVRGDTCTIGGASHVLSTTASGASIAFKAA